LVCRVRLQANSFFRDPLRPGYRDLSSGGTTVSFAASI
jgi:hypothetical protein